MLRPGVTVAIPTIPRRVGMLGEAVESALEQRRPPDAISVAVDRGREGAYATRNRALGAVQTEWVAFLDDDDLLLPDHVEACLMHAETTGADLIYPWFTVQGGADPLACPVDGVLVNPFGVPFGPEQEAHLREVGNFVPVTTLVRTELALEVGGFPAPGSDWWSHGQNEDWGFLIRLLIAGATFAHLPQRTWIWRHHGRNTSGLPHRW